MSDLQKAKNALCALAKDTVPVEKLMVAATRYARAQHIREVEKAEDRAEYELLMAARFFADAPPLDSRYAARQVFKKARILTELVDGCAPPPREPWMSFAKYEELAARTRGDQSYPNDLLNAALGLAGEAGEVVDIVKKRVFHDVGDPAGQFLDELGDVLWYLAWLAAQHGATLEEVAARNIDKLEKRYPDGFETGGGRRDDD